MIIKGNNIYKTRIETILSKMSNINSWRKAFLTETLILFLCIKGRINFLQLGRYGKHGEQRYRQQFEKPFDFLTFNIELTLSQGSGRYAIAFDPSHINKAGKYTPGLGHFWSGCANRAKWGLEIGGLAAIDIDNHTAFHLEAVQTIVDKEQSLSDWYANLISERKVQLHEISQYLVADAWFAKRTFVDQVLKADMHLIGRLRDDANLRYLYQGEPTGKPGRPKKYDGKVDNTNIDMSHFKLVSKDEQVLIHNAIVYSISLKRNIKVVHARYFSNKGKQSNKLYFSTDIKMDASDILKFYQSRFQIEFLYRDGKQHTGLNDCQARSENKLDFHFNASLTAINLAKVAHWLCIPKEDRRSFSMTDIKTINHNELQLNLFFDKFGIDPHLPKNQEKARELLYYGTIAA
ncbi:transposase [Halosquirtibacter xylanolyticus]|uniref:transposase n=1 Tax=Halosquirtibacter xylanolyticus TaxID=3374599 RepID=UPI003749E9D0|nr:transposase [Prolixibacteraceae bacterium]